MKAHAHPLRYHIGDVIAGKYRLTESLGEGGMGEVWEGVNMVLDAPVAIKLMKPEVSDDVLRQRLLQEARTAAGLSHPAIIRVFDVGETSNGDPYVVMERLHGKSLREVIDDGLTPDVVEIGQALLPILDALSLAHGRGLVHRDVKPDNIFLAEAGPERLQPKLLDFGVVKAQAHHRYLTHTGTVVGSPPYMSPEQARGDDDIDHLADLWAVCVILYEAVTGAVPFDAPNYNALLRRIVEDEAEPLPETDPSLVGLAPIIRRGLLKEREERWQSAEELGRALGAWLIGLGVGEDLTGRRISGRWVAAGRRSIADRRRASLFDIQADELPTLPPLSRDSDSADRNRSSAPTLRGYRIGPRKVVPLAVGLGALLVAGLVGWYAVSTAEPDLAAEAPLAPEVAGDAPAALSAASDDEQAETAAAASRGSTAGSGDETDFAPTTQMRPLEPEAEVAPAPRASKKRAVRNRAPASSKRRKEPEPKDPAPEENPPRDLGLKDPY